MNVGIGCARVFIREELVSIEAVILTCWCDSQITILFFSNADEFLTGGGEPLVLLHSVTRQAGIWTCAGPPPGPLLYFEGGGTSLPDWWLPRSFPPNPDPLPCWTPSNVVNAFSPMLFILIFFEMNIRVFFPSLHTGGKKTESYIQRTVRKINTYFLYNVQSSLLKWLFWRVLRSFIVSCHGDHRWLKNAEFGVRLLTFNSCRILSAKNELRATGSCQNQI